MKFEKFVVFSFINSFFYLVLGQTNEKTDCTILYNFINQDFKNYSNECCESINIECDEDEYITSLKISVNDSMFKNTDINSFPYLSKLKKLYIDGGNYKEIPESILKLSSLEILQLTWVNLEVIPSDIQKLSQLKELVLSGNSIKEIPNKLFNLKNLRILNLDINQIEEIPSGIGKLFLLETLSLNDNNIKEIPKKLYDLTKLRILNLGSNNIEEISSDIGKLLKLETLNLEKNNVKEIPPEIEDLFFLDTLNLNLNYIKELPNGIFKLRNLKELNLNDNTELSTIMLNFGTIPIENCHFDNINILCYEYNTCKSFGGMFNETESVSKKQLKICTKEEIDKFLNQKTSNKKSSSINIDDIININDIIIGNIIGILATLTILLFNKYKYKIQNKISISSDEEFRTRSISGLLNRIFIRKNNINDSNIGFNHNNSDNDNDNQDNSHESLNKQNPLSSKGDNSISKNGKTTKDENIYNASVAEINEKPLSNDNNDINTNTKAEENNHYVSIVEEDEPLFDYKEINKLISKY